MSHLFVRSLGLWLLLGAPGATPLRADDAGVAGRQILARYQAAVVTVKIAANLRMSFGGQDQRHESKSEAVGTVIDPGGLTVISLSAIDPSKTFDELVNQRARRGGQQFEMKIDSEVTDLQLVLADGRELPATVVLRDNDLDLAYLRPVAPPAQPLTHVDLAATAVPQLLEPTIALHRLGKVANRAPTVSVERINAMVERPRPFYVLGGGQGLSGIGSPVFNLAGELLGIVLLRAVAPEGDGNLGAMFSGGAAMGLLPIIVPTADVREGAAQAAAAAK